MTDLSNTVVFPAFRRNTSTITIRGLEYTFYRESVDGKVLNIERKDTGTVSALNAREFWKLYETGELVLDEGSMLVIPKRFLEHLDSEIEPNRDSFAWKAFRRFKYAVAADRYPNISKTDAGLKPIIEKVAVEISDSAPPAPKTLARWLRQRGAPQMRCLVLMAEKDDRKGRGDWLEDDQEEIVEEVIEKYYKARRQLNINEIHEEVCGQIAIRNKTKCKELGLDDQAYEGLSNKERDDLELLTHPHYTTVLRRIRRHEGYDTTARRDGKKVANDQYMPLKDPPRATRANQIWYIDHTRADAHLVYDEKSKAVLGCPWMTIVIDGYSRYIVGFFITFLPPSVHSLAMALKNAISSKRYVQQKFPGIEDEWVSYGLPEMVVCDRGLELTSHSFEIMCAHCGIEVRWCGRKKPQWKGIVERVNRTIRTHLINLFAGSTRKDAQKLRKEERKPTEEAEIDYQTLDKNFHKWVVAVYAKKVHKGIQAIPAERYSESVRAHRPRVLNHSRDLSVFGVWRKVSLSRAGITFLYLNYKNFNATFDMLDQSGSPTIDVWISIDPSNVAKIVVRHPTTGALFEFVCGDPEMSRGVSLWEHRAFLAYMRAKNYDLAKREKWLIAKKEIRDGAMRTLLKKNAKISDRQNAARTLGIGSEGNFDEDPIGFQSDGTPPWLDMEFAPPDLAPDLADGNYDWASTSDAPKQEAASLVEGGRPKRSRLANKKPSTRKKKKPPPAQDPAPNDAEEAVVASPSDGDRVSRLKERLAKSSFPSI